jgi:hypothetical protein
MGAFLSNVREIPALAAADGMSNRSGSGTEVDFSFLFLRSWSARTGNLIAPDGVTPS